LSKANKHIALLFIYDFSKINRGILGKTANNNKVIEIEKI